MTTGYRKNWNPHPRKRIDTRPPSPEKAAGDRSLHYGTDGSVIGGVTAEGIPYGTRTRQGPKDGSSLGNPITPGLDRRVTMDRPVSANPHFVGPPVPVTAPATGKQLADRQALYAEMVRAGRAGITPEMQERATALGVAGPSWQNTVAGIQLGPRKPSSNPSATSNPAAGTSNLQQSVSPAPTTTGTPAPNPLQDILKRIVATFLPSSKTAPTAGSNPVRQGPPMPPTGGGIQSGTEPFKQGQDAPGLTPQAAANTPGNVIPKALNPNYQRINRLTGKPFGYTPPVGQTPPTQYGADIAERNIAKMGQAGAVADYFKRSAADAAKVAAVKAKKTTDQWRGATAPVLATNRMAPTPPLQKGFRDMAGLPSDMAKNFTAPPLANYQPIAMPPVPNAAAAAPVTAPPVSQFQAMTTPKGAAPNAPATAVPAVSNPAPTGPAASSYRQPQAPPTTQSGAYAAGKAVHGAVDAVGTGIRNFIAQPDYSGKPAFTGPAPVKPLQLNTVKAPELTEEAKRTLRPVKRRLQEFSAGLSGR